ncbi:protein phosphatase 2C domain-containing protein [Streptomyces sp. NPDC057617]|uniref:protein phosphatase 2C domain-containing protein n=1 Tax=Streptomyces sp. NPDC057617 TaxID=3346184 RepID=UPI0036A04E13
MSQQGQTPAGDDWWNRLYDDSAPDTGPGAASGDTLDDRFDSAAGTVGTAGRDARGTAGTPAESPGAPDPYGTSSAPDRYGPGREGRDGGIGRDGVEAQRPLAWWEQVPDEPAGPPYTPSDARPLPGSTDARRADSPERPGPSERPERSEPPERPERRDPRMPETGASPASGPAAGPAASRPAAPGPASSGRDTSSGPAAPGSGATGDTVWLPRQSGPSQSSPFPSSPSQSGPSASPSAGAAWGTSQPRPEPDPAPAAPPPTPPPPAPQAPLVPPTPPEPPAPSTPPVPPRSARSAVTHLGDRPPKYHPEPATLPAADAEQLHALVPDTVLDGASYGSYTLRAVSVRGDSARHWGEPRGDALLTARFGTGIGALVLVAVASGARGSEHAHLAAAEVCHWIGGAVGRSHSRLSEDIRAGRRGDLKSGLHRLTDRGFGRLRARAAELALEPEEYSASLRCLLLSADPECRTRVFFGVGDGGLFRLRDGVWHDLEPLIPEPDAITGDAVVGFGSPSAETPGHDQLTMDLAITKPPSPYIEGPLPPPSEPFRFRASVARPGDTLLLCSGGLAEPLRGEPALAEELAARWARTGPPGLTEYLADVQLRVKGYADDRTAAAVWER